MFHRVLSPFVAVALCIALLALASHSPNEAEACGCLSPPIPEVSSEEYAVNQQSEQIIFEVEGGFVTAHVLIRYAGAPESFAWIVPVPSVPELSLSETLAFGLLDTATEPLVSVSTPSLCPSAEYTCRHHPWPDCPNDRDGNGVDDSFDQEPSPSPDAEPGGENSPPGDVVVYDRAKIGAYETVTFGAGDASGAVQWLQEEGFIVNDTMVPYMQTYLDNDMLFVASKLIAGAEVSEIRPLRMRFESTNPMIPLQLTAVAAEPHLTVTAYIFADAPYEPIDHPLLGINPEWVSIDTQNRVNYPMVLARAADLAGGDGFVMEYSGEPLVPTPNSDSGCCGEGGDVCGVAFDGLCQCPGDDFDYEDCSQNEDFEELLAGITLLQDLQSRHTHMTRLTTRLSAEEMTFDPAFRPMQADPPVQGRLRFASTRRQMNGCVGDIIDRDLFDSIEEVQACAATYCGQGECVITHSGAPGCACEPGFVGRAFNDVDGQRSVTCVPQTNTVDFGADGLELPSACEGLECGQGTCVDVGGFPTCRCFGENAAIIDGNNPAPTCEGISRRSRTAGAQDYTTIMEEVRACAPAPPESCGQYGWLAPNENIQRQGVICPSSLPDPEQLIIPDPPTCEDLHGDTFDPRNPNDPGVDNPDLQPTPQNPDAGGADTLDGCATAPGRTPAGALWLLALIGLLWRRRR